MNSCKSIQEMEIFVCRTHTFSPGVTLLAWLKINKLGWSYTPLYICWETFKFSVTFNTLFSVWACFFFLCCYCFNSQCRCIRGKRHTDQPSQISHILAVRLALPTSSVCVHDAPSPCALNVGCCINIGDICVWTHAHGCSVVIHSRIFTTGCINRSY